MIERIRLRTFAVDDTNSTRATYHGILAERIALARLKLAKLDGPARDELEHHIATLEQQLADDRQAQ